MEQRDRGYKIFQPLEPEPALYISIIEGVCRLQRRAARVRIAAFGGIAAVCGAALIPALQYLLEQLSDSGFYEYLSLFMSDRAVVLTYWREFAFSLFESLPSVALLLLIPICAALWWSLRRAWRTAPSAFALLQS